MAGDSIPHLIQGPLRIIGGAGLQPGTVKAALITRIDNVVATSPFEYPGAAVRGNDIVAAAALDTELTLAAQAIPAASDNPVVACAALNDIGKGIALNVIVARASLETVGIASGNPRGSDEIGGIPVAVT